MSDEANKQKRFRVDFNIMEIGAAREQAQGIRFGDDVGEEALEEFFDKCQAAALSLFGPAAKARSEARRRETLEFYRNELEKLKEERNQSVQKLPLSYQKLPLTYKVITGSVDFDEKDQQIDAYRQMYRTPPGDDGSRGGDGTMSESFMEKYREAKAVELARGRY